MCFQKVKGFQDIYGEAAVYWERVTEISREVFRLFSAEELTLPILERSEVFNRSIGETTDIVEKEMFSFQDKDGNYLSLRPEGTAGALRAYIENGCPQELNRLYYLGPMFRREKPQKGRFRQFTQAGAEFIGSASPFTDAELIFLFTEIFRRAGVADITRLEINSVGCADCRPAYHKKLSSYLIARKSSLCGDCNRRIERNPLRVLDCKNEQCAPIIAASPLILDCLCTPCQDHLGEVKKFLSIMDIAYTMNPRMVRGLDYYTRTAFEMVTDRLGAAAAVGGGGRYDNLLKHMGGPDLGGVGFAIGLDRVVTLMRETRKIEKTPPEVYIITFPDTFERGIALLSQLRKNGVAAMINPDGGSVKSRMKKADRANARYAAILGGDELKDGKIGLKEMKTSLQHLTDIDGLLDFLRSDKC
jgi:histidyl-tRNA synthetase